MVGLWKERDGISSLGVVFVDSSEVLVLVPGVIIDYGLHWDLEQVWRVGLASCGGASWLSGRWNREGVRTLCCIDAVL